MTKNHVLTGSCGCSQWQVKIRVSESLKNLSPRICDCDYCHNHPSAIISAPNMVTNLVGGIVKINQNGDQLASFYYCDNCNDLLAVGCELKDVLRGAVSSGLFGDTSQFGEPVKIQPRLLTASEKLDRWGTLWGQLNGV